jgi:hypothetical protein
MTKRIDLLVHGEGSVCLLRAVSRRGRRWIDEHVSDERQEWGGAIAVEHRYISDIARGARTDGLRVQRLGYPTLRLSSTLVPGSDIAGLDDALVPREIESSDPGRWADYNRKFNALFTRTAR